MKNEKILLNEFEFVEVKLNKVKIILAILASTLIVDTLVILLLGHFKFDWFKSDEYKIDAHINKSLFQANYFSEKKTINAKFTFNEHTEEKEYIIDKDFVVFITEKKGNLNTALLVILSSIASIDDEIHEFSHLNMFDEEQIKDLETNPDGSKYPMAMLKFMDDGKIEEIYLPNNMDKYNAKSIIELINKVILKLSRNKKEDISNGLEITYKKVNNKRTIIQKEAPKQFEEFKGSKLTKVIKTEIENGQITNIESYKSLYMESKPEGDETMFGPKYFSFNEKSEITSKEIKYNAKENIALINKLAEKFTFIESEILFNIITNKKEEANTENEVVEKENHTVRNLFSISAFKIFDIASFDVLGQTVSVKYVVGISSDMSFNKIVISSTLGVFEFGNTGCSGEISEIKSYNRTIFSFVDKNFSEFLEFHIDCYVTGKLSFGLGLISGNGKSAKYWAAISGSLDLGAYITNVIGGDPENHSFRAFAEGAVVNANGKVILSNGSVSKDSGFKLSIGKLVVGVTHKILYNGDRKTLWSETLYGGKTIS